MTIHKEKGIKQQNILILQFCIFLNSNSLSLKMEDSAYDGSVLFLKVNLEKKNLLTREKLFYNYKQLQNQQQVLDIRQKIMEDKAYLKLKLPTASEKLKSLFPQDPRSDLVICFKTKKFKLQRAYLRLQSQYFAQKLVSQPKSIQIKEDFEVKYSITQQQEFQKILSLLFGYTVLLNKQKIDDYYQIANFLKIEWVVSQIFKDIMENIESYCIFSIIKLSHLQGEQRLFQLCHEQLEKHEFSQMKNNSFQLYRLDLTMLKLLIKMHKQFRQKKNGGIPYSQIDELLRQYCQINDLGLEKYDYLKFELFDPNSLTSSQYKKIFLKQVSQSQSQQSQPQLTQSEQKSPERKKSKNIIQEMKNTFERKKNEELESHNKYLEAQMQKIRNITNLNQDTHSQMQQQLHYLRDELTKKEKQDIQQKNVIRKYQQVFNRMQKELQRKSQEISSLTKKFQEMKNNININESDYNGDIITQSQFLPAHMINQVMAEHQQSRKAKSQTKYSQEVGSLEKAKQVKVLKNKEINYDDLDQQELEELYQSRIVFDQEPRSIEKKQLPWLANLLTDNGFNRKQLNLVYRCSLNGASVGKKQDLFSKEKILFLFKTQQGIKLGGFISKPITPNATYIADPNAFLFSVSHKTKHNVEQNRVKQALHNSEKYLISFCNDLIISKDCLNEISYCYWPKAYSRNTNDGTNNSEYLAGSSQFYVETAEAYEIREQQMQMVL